MTKARTQSITVLIVDDHAVFAQSLAAALRGSDDIEVIGIAHDGRDAIEQVQSLQPNVVLLDYQLPDVTGSSLIQSLSALPDSPRIIVLTASVAERTILDAMQAGCVGYVTKDQGLDHVLAAVRAVAAGQAVLPPRLLGQMIPGNHRVARFSLTRRESQTLTLLATGANNEAIAEALHVSRNTVRNHVQNLLQKLSAHSRLEAVAKARASGLLNDHDQRV